MPELPEVETIARQLDAALAGRVFGEVVHLRLDMVRGADRPLRRALPGQRIVRIYRQAKRVVFDFEPRSHAATKPRTDVEAQRQDSSQLAMDERLQLVVHLGMTGRLTVCDAKEPVEKHTHLRVAIENTGRELRFRDPRRFGGIWVLSIGDCRLSIGSPAHAQNRDRKGAVQETSKSRKVETLKPQNNQSIAQPPRHARKRVNRQSTIDNRQSRNRDLGPLGPEPLELTAAAFRRVLGRKRQIKALLMDQTAIAGLGNIYCDESLHAAGIHPLTPADTLSTAHAGRLLRAIKNVLRKAIRFAGSTFMDYRSAEGEPGSFQKFHRVYAREGEPCGTCKTPITRIQAAGRSTFYCPNCQPANRVARNRRPLRAEADRHC